MQGKMKIKGNLGAAQKFTPDTFPNISKLWCYNLNSNKYYLVYVVL
jgi:hypothetical protein